MRDLAIDYTALSLVAPERIHFRYKLEGQDPEWREVVNVHQVQYSNLPPRHYLTLASDVANDYFTLLQMDLQLQITRETVATQTDSVKLTKFRLEHGVATKLDVLQAQQVLDTADAQIPELERQIAQEENAINILLGNYPDGVPRGLALVEQDLPPDEFLWNSGQESRIPAESQAMLALGPHRRVPDSPP